MVQTWTSAVLMVVPSFVMGTNKVYNYARSAIYVVSTLSPILPMGPMDPGPSTTRAVSMGKWWPPLGRVLGWEIPDFYPRKSQGIKRSMRTAPNSPLRCFFLNPPSSTQGHGCYDWMSCGTLGTGGV